MSGSNPFRRSRVVEADPSSANIFINPAAADALEDAPLPTPPKRTKKKVTIQTPPLSPESPNFIHSPDHGGRRLSASDSAGRAPSPPPVVDSQGTDDGVNESSAPAAADPDLDQAMLNMRINSGSMTPPSGAVSSMGMGGARAPYNPFARTLATSEASFAGKQQQGKGQPKETGTRQTPAFDVDMFKNILLTGAPVPSGVSVNNAPASRPQDSSSSTETSSIFEPAYGPPPHSPHRDTFDDYESASEDDEDERSGLMGTGRSDDLAPPAPPKRNVKAKGPQTVSFADFDHPIPPGLGQGPRSPPVHAQHLTGILRASSPRPNSDLNKPLPPPPKDMPEVAPPSVPDKDSPLQPTPAPDAEATPKKPPPPPSRKTGGHGRARSASNLSNMTQDSVAEHGEVVTSSNSTKLVPPPPPSRRPQSIIRPSTEAMPVQPSLPQTHARLAPAPPPRRHGSTASRNSRTASRQTSDDSTTAQRTDTAGLSGPAAPPPPPPRREKGSKRTSFEGTPGSLPRRLSGEHRRGTSFDSERSASISSLHQVSEAGEATDHAVISPPADSSRDVLADMAAFEAEINALRAQQERGK